MFHGPGNDGLAVTGPAAADRLATTLLRSQYASEPAAELLESERMTGWSPAPGAMLVLPERFTPTYAYPALIWLAEPGETESSMQPWLEAVSSRNFVGIGLRPAMYSGSSNGDPTEGGRQQGLARFANMMRCVDNWVQLHPQRRYVVGARASARTAIEWLLARPDWFAGSIAIDSTRESTVAWRASSPLAQQRRLLWLRTPEQSSADDTEQAELLALQCLGISISHSRMDRSAGPAELGDRINRWILRKIPTAILD